jgi:hypothetical protein
MTLAYTMMLVIGAGAIIGFIWGFGRAAYRDLCGRRREDDDRIRLQDEHGQWWTATRK